jgi:E3 ubiquitin-protein ligase HUWE1
MKEYYNTIMHQLVHAVQKIIDSIQGELEELKKTLSDKNIEVQKITFHDLTSASSKQAQILRILKAIDFLEAKRISKSRTNSTEDNNDKMQGVTQTINNEENTVDNHKENSITTVPNKKSLNKSTEDELLHIYDQLTVKPLWNKLGNILTIINNNRDLIHVATILLPLIESFMVISKPYVLNKPEKQQSSAQLLNSDVNDMNNQSNEEIFYSMTNEHRKILNAMVRNNPSLMKNSFALLVSNSKILDFDNKRTYFNQQLHKRNGREHYGTLQIAVRRQYVFEDSFHKLQGKTGNEIKYSKLNVRFVEEEGVDVGGVTREWFSALARQMFNPDYALFKPSAQDRVTYQPNRNSWINPDHLSFFKFVGRIIGKAIYDGRALDCYFTRSFYKHILNIDVDYKDIEAIDPEYFKSIEWILHNDITDVLDLTFSLEIDEFGKKSVIDLKPNGRNIPVTEENKVEYVKLVTEQRLTVAIKQQIEAFLDGFHDIIPHSLISIFNEQELELLISGLPEIDIDDWKNNTVYENYSSSSPQVQWFWRAVRSFTQEERAKLIQFTTGTSKVPLEGFSNLQGVNGIQKFQIHKDFGSIERLPSAHTCFNQLDIPAYESYEHLRKALLLAINECSVGFGFA